MKTLFGDINARETEEQAAFVAWWRMRFPKVLIFAIPNGASLAGDWRQRAIQMARMKREGLVKGMPDLCVPRWWLWIEMKRTRGAVVSEDQLGIQSYLRGACNHTIIIAKGRDDAIDQVETFVTGRGSPLQSPRARS